MSAVETLTKKFLSSPNIFSYDELRRFLGRFGYREIAKGKTSGSRVAFFNDKTGHLIRLHKPHPGNNLKQYQIALIREELEKKGLL
jgi:hypothetical protein